MTAPPGNAQSASSTARPAEKGADSRTDAAMVRRATTALVELSARSGQPMRRGDARRTVLERISDEQSPAEVEAYLRATYRQDPTGVTAARNVDRGHRRAGGPDAVA